MINLAITAFTDPSPFSFIGATTLFTLAVLLQHYEHRSNNYQNIFLTIGISIALSFAALKHALLMDHTILPDIKQWLVIGILASTWASMLWHCIGWYHDEQGQLRKDDMHMVSEKKAPVEE